MLSAAPSRDVDVAVVGAGPAGSTLARRLVAEGRSVALVERSWFDVPRVGESLAPAVQPLLRELGAWDAFLALTPLPSFGTLAWWGDEAARSHSHLMTPWGCGWHVDRLAFDRMLAQVAEAGGAQLVRGAACVGCEESGAGWKLTLRSCDQDGREAGHSLLRARVVVDATGRGARLATRVGASRLLIDQLVAVAARFDGVHAGAEGHVMVEAAADGWWYTAPLPDQGMIAMLMTDGDLCGRGAMASREVWAERLHAATATCRRVGRHVAAAGPRVVPALSQRLRRHGRMRPWLAVGDAALAVDPISGSGVVRALRIARAAAETVLRLLESGRATPIETYEAALDRECAEYLLERTWYYGLEERWPESPFWRRRRAH